ncbi:MAG TPA: HTTM domain-containing protein [Chroococcales cyanobacterium]
MSLFTLIKAWQSFWFKASSPLPVALYRILFGILLLQNALLLGPDLNTLYGYGRDAIVSATTSREWTQDLIVDALFLLPSNNQSLQLFFAILTGASLTLTLGLFSRTSAFVVFICLAAFHHRNWTVINSGDIFMRLAALYLALSPAGKTLSLDRIVAVWFSNSREEAFGAPQSSSPWVQRVMQLQLAMLYCQAFLTKFAGGSWMSGDAVYYVLRLQDFQRIKMPFIYDNLLLMRLLTWATLLVEFALWALIWIKELRYYILLAGVALHVGIDLSLNLPIFEYLMITAYVLFVDAGDLAGIMNWIRARFHKLEPHRWLIVYDGGDEIGVRVAESIRRFDILQRFDFVDCSLCEAGQSWANLLGKTTKMGEMPHNTIALLDSQSRRWKSGAPAVFTVLMLLPWAIPMAPAIFCFAFLRKVFRTTIAVKSCPSNNP